MIRTEEGTGSRLGSGPDAAIESRIPLAMAVVLVVFAGFGLRLFQLQILRGEELAGIAHGNAVRLVRLEAPRGDILDREGRVLASTRPAFGVSAMPADLREPVRTFRVLGRLIDEETQALSERFGEPRGRRRFQPVRLARDLSWDDKARVEAHLYALPGLNIDRRPRRHYVEGELAAHLLGTIGEVRRDQLESEAYAGYRAGEIVGQTGVERLLEPGLRGRAGGRNEVVDVRGRVVQLLTERAPQPGGTVRLTLDLDLQRAAEEGFRPEVLGEPAKMGAAIALDPRTGDLLAMVSKPAFDPNSFAGGIDAQTWRALSEDEWRPLQNRALSGQYPPGSAYKPLVAAAGLAAGVLRPEEKVFCPGHFRLGRRLYRCWKRGGHGAVDLREALRSSCDVFFYHLGLELGVDRIADVARSFGLGRRTGIPIRDEKLGLVPTREWKERRFGEVWMRGETVSASIGQGFNLVTPLQLAVAYGALATGYRVEPRLVLQAGEGPVAASPRERLSIDPAHLARLRDALVAAVEEPGGTGGRARVPGIRVAGKTGTAQVVRLRFTEDLEEGEVPIRHRDHAWFAAFAPAEVPEIVVVVLVEHGGHGGSAAAPIAGRVLARYFEKRLDRAGEALAALP